MPPSLQAACVAVLVCVCLGAWRGGAAALAAIRRELPWGQRVSVEVVVSLAVDPDDEEIRESLERWSGGVGSGAPSGMRGLPGAVYRAGDAVRAAWNRARGRFAQVEVHWRLDAAARNVAGEVRTAFVLPMMVRVLRGDGVVTITHVDAGGAVSALVAGRPVTLKAGEGYDLALVPAGGGLWAADDRRMWREVILSRLGEGLAVGRLSVLNLGSGDVPERSGAAAEQVWCNVAGR